MQNHRSVQFLSHRRYTGSGLNIRNLCGGLLLPLHYTRKGSGRVGNKEADKVLVCSTLIHKISTAHSSQIYLVPCGYPLLTVIAMKNSEALNETQLVHLLLYKLMDFLRLVCTKL